MNPRKLLLVFTSFLTFSGLGSSSTAHESLILDGKPYRVTVTSQGLSERLLRIEFESGAIGLVDDKLIVGFSSREVLARYFDESQIEMISGMDAARIQLKSPVQVLEWSKKLQGEANIRYAHPDFQFQIEAREADPTSEPLFKDQWNLFNQRDASGVDIGVLEAWNTTLGRPDVVVALLDLGFEQDHEDLKDAWFVNPLEIPGNKKDDDRNGLVDDVSGWNFSVNGPNLIYGQNSKHGTATAGIVGARINGRGVAGICPECKILPIVVSGRVSEDAAAILYALNMGASVMSNSWGYYLEPPRTDVVSDALHRAATDGRGGKGIPIVFAMHNASVGDCRASHPDISAHPDVIAVSSVDSQDRKVKESGYGKCLAFVAPSSGSVDRGIVTTDRAGSQGYNTDGRNNYADLSYHNGFWGTSAAAPQVTGLFALLLSQEPDIARAQAFERMKSSALKVNPVEANYDPETGHSVQYGYGRVHAGGLFRP